MIGDPGNRLLSELSRRCAKDVFTTVYYRFAVGVILKVGKEGTVTAENLRFVKSIPFQLFIGMTLILLVSFLTRLINTRVQRKQKNMYDIL